MNIHDRICFKALKMDEPGWIEGDLIHDDTKTLILPFAKIGEVNRGRSGVIIRPDTICINIPFACYNNIDDIPNAIYMGDILEVCGRHDNFHGDWYVIAENHDTVFGCSSLVNNWKGHWHPQDTIRVRPVSNIYDDDAAKYINGRMIDEFRRFMHFTMVC